jgi:hypothetical protein
LWCALQQMRLKVPSAEALATARKKASHSSGAGRRGSNAPITAGQDSAACTNNVIQPGITLRCSRDTASGAQTGAPVREAAVEGNFALSPAGDLMLRGTRRPNQWAKHCYSSIPNIPTSFERQRRQGQGTTMGRIVR